MCDGVVKNSQLSNARRPNKYNTAAEATTTTAVAVHEARFVVLFSVYARISNCAHTLISAYSNRKRRKQLLIFFFFIKNSKTEKHESKRETTKHQNKFKFTHTHTPEPLVLPLKCSCSIKSNAK